MDEKIVAALRQERERLLAHLQALKQIHGEEAEDYVTVQVGELVQQAIDKGVINRVHAKRIQKRRRTSKKQLDPLSTEGNAGGDNLRTGS